MDSSHDSLLFHIPVDMFAPAETVQLEGDWALDVLTYGPDCYVFDEPLAWQVDITNTGGAFLVAGTVTGTAKSRCARCLEDVAVPLTGEVEGYFLVPGGGVEPDEEEEFELLPEDNTIDLEPLLRAAILLELPLVPLCKEDCKGICPECGADLNEGPCSCNRFEDNASQNANNPFAALKDYRFEG